LNTKIDPVCHCLETLEGVHGRGRGITNCGSLLLAEDAFLPNATRPRGICPSEIARIILEQVIPNHREGFTFCPLQKACIPEGSNADPDAYIYSIQGHLKEFRGLPSEIDLTKWIRIREVLLSRTGNFIGGWLKRRIFHLDLSLEVYGKELAMELAQENGQEEIYHPATMKCLPVIA